MGVRADPGGIGNQKQVKHDLLTYNGLYVVQTVLTSELLHAPSLLHIKSSEFWRGSDIRHVALAYKIDVNIQK